MTKTDKGWALLAAAIIESGVKSNDQSFLKSRWCEDLKELVRLYVEEQDKTLDGSVFDSNRNKAVKFALQ